VAESALLLSVVAILSFVSVLSPSPFWFDVDVSVALLIAAFAASTAFCMASDVMAAVVASTSCPVDAAPLSPMASDC